MHATLISWRQLVRLQPGVSRRLRALGDALDPVDFARRIARICAWLPVLWRDRDWDAAYMVRILQFKLRRMADHIEKHGHLANSDRVARDMRITAARFDRYLDSHKYGPPFPLPESKLLEFEDCPDHPGYSQLKEKPPRERAKELRWSRQHQAIENENWDAAWETIRTHGRGWWD